MYRLCISVLMFALLLPVESDAGGRTYVRGHIRKDGAYVPPHYRTAPDSSFYNNWSTLGNINPYTGKPGTKTEPSSPSRLRFYPSTAPGFIFAPVPPALSSTIAPLPKSLSPRVGTTSVERPPESIDEEIKSLATAQWPNDFSMQVYTIKKQREGYAALHSHLRTYSNLGLADQIRDWALTNARREWPNDYSMQAYSYEKNLDGYLRLSALVSSDEWKRLPEDHANWMMERVYEQWANDFSMQAYALEKQIDGYYELARLESQLGELPKDVADGIRRKARSSWPNDLSMQAYTIRKETEGYLEMQRITK